MIRGLWVFCAVAALALSGCASSGHKSASNVPGQSTAAASESESSSSADEASDSGSSTAAAGGPVTVSIATTEMGKVLTGPTGHALYTYDPDTSQTSACTGKCASAWPPLVGTPTAAKGVDAAELATITRADGSTQVVYDGHPLYYYAKDTDEEDVYGDGVGGLWHVAKASGE